MIARVESYDLSLSPLECLSGCALTRRGDLFQPFLTSGLFMLDSVSVPISLVGSPQQVGITSGSLPSDEFCVTTDCILILIAWQLLSVFFPV